MLYKTTRFALWNTPSVRPNPLTPQCSPLTLSAFPGKRKDISHTYTQAISQLLRTHTNSAFSRPNRYELRSLHTTLDARTWMTVRARDPQWRGLWAPISWLTAKIINLHHSPVRNGNTCLYDQRTGQNREWVFIPVYFFSFSIFGECECALAVCGMELSILIYVRAMHTYP